ncbi:uncharacterized protein BDFB_000644, partial [Asbolus verrucosus]
MSQRRVTSIHSCLCFMLIFAQCFGMLPVSGITNEDYGSLKFRWTSKRTLYSIIFTLSAVANITFHTMRIVRDGKIKFEDCVTLLFFLVTIITVVFFIDVARKWPDLMQKWEEVDMAMSCYQFPLGLHKKLKIIATIVIGGAIVEHSFFTAHMFQYSEKGNNLIENIDHYFHFRYDYVFEILDIFSSISWNFMDLFIILVSLCLSSRFTQVAKNIHFLIEKQEMDENIWRKLREDYTRLTILCTNVDDVISKIILISFGNNVFVILVQLSNSIKPSSCDNTLDKIYYIYSFAFLIFRITTVLLYAATVNTESKRPVYDLNSLSHHLHNVEIERFLYQTDYDTAALTGHKFFRVTKPLIISLAGAIVSYELVLIEKWPLLLKQWTKVDIAMSGYGFPNGLHKKLKIVTVVIISAATENKSFIETVNCYFRTRFDHVFAVVTYNIWYGIYIQILNIFSTVSWNFMDLFIMLISLCLSARFVQVVKSVRFLAEKKKADENAWRKLREDYTRLTVLCGIVDDNISNIILMSFGNNVFVTLVQLFNSLQRPPSHAVVDKIYYVYSFAFLVIRIIAVVVYAATVHSESKKPAYHLTALSQHVYNIEIERFLYQTKYDTTALTGHKLFKVTKSLILRLAGAIVSYELCFGMLPVSGITERNSSFLKFDWTSKPTIYSIVFALLAAVNTIFHIIRMIRDDIIDFGRCGNDNFSAIITLITLLFFLVTVFTVVIFIDVARKWPALMKKWTEVDMEMSRYGFPRGLHKKLVVVSVIIISAAIVEHALFVVHTFRSLSRYTNFKENIDSYFQVRFDHIFAVVTYNIWYGICAEILNIFSTISWNFMDLFIILVSLCLSARFAQVTRYISFLTKKKESDEKIWGKLREDYTRLTILCRTVDDYISNIILMSIGNNIFVIIVQLFNSLRRPPIHSVLEKAYHIYSFIFLVIRIIIVVLHAAAIHSEGKKLGYYLSTLSHQVYNIEVARFLYQVKYDTIALTGSKFFKVTKSLILSGISGPDFRSLHFTWKSFRVAYTLLTISGASFVSGMQLHKILTKGLDLLEADRLFFNLSGVVAGCLFLNFAKNWPKLMRDWSAVESSMLSYGWPSGLNKKLNTLMAAFMFTALVEHILVQSNKLRLSLECNNSTEEAFEYFLSHMSYSHIFSVMNYDIYKGLIAGAIVTYELVLIQFNKNLLNSFQEESPVFGFFPLHGITNPDHKSLKFTWLSLKTLYSLLNFLLVFLFFLSIVYQMVYMNITLLEIMDYALWKGLIIQIERFTDQIIKNIMVISGKNFFKITKGLILQ